jgi:hypothetical protein
VTIGNGLNIVTAVVMTTAAGPCLNSGGGGGGGSLNLSSSFWTGLGLASVGGVLAVLDVTKNPLGRKAKAG